MSGLELIVDNSEEICFPVPHLWRDHENGLVLVQFQCGRSFIEPLQRRVEGELRKHRTVVG